ncbi:acyl-CoA N-acyltransferase [Obelidium mucronatum]|nr:acyl-CoA N-acyltransferase [Obelidium mucronatum]
MPHSKTLHRLAPPADSEALATTFANTFECWGQGYEDSVEAWVLRKQKYNVANNITVWILKTSDGTLVAQAETIQESGWIKGCQDPVPVVGIGAVFVREELRGKGHGKAIMTQLIQKLKDEGEVKVVYLMAGGADSIYYGQFGFKRAPYKLLAFQADSPCSATLHNAKSMSAIDLKRISLMDSLALRTKVSESPTKGSFALVPSVQRHSIVRNVYLSFGNAPVGDSALSTSLGAWIDDHNFLVYAHFYRNKRLCITRMESTSQENVRVLLEAAKYEAARCGFEWIYLWLGEQDKVLAVGTTDACGFIEKEWFDEPMFRFLDDTYDGLHYEWLANQRYITTTM